MLTLVATFELRLADEGGRVDLVRAQEHVVRVGDAAPDVGARVLAAAVVALILVLVAVSAEERVELIQTNLVKSCLLLTILHKVN